MRRFRSLAAYQIHCSPKTRVCSTRSDIIWALWLRVSDQMDVSHSLEPFLHPTSSFNQWLCLLAEPFVFRLQPHIEVQIKYKDHWKPHKEVWSEISKTCLFLREKQKYHSKEICIYSHLLAFSIYSYYHLLLHSYWLMSRHIVHSSCTLWPRRRLSFTPRCKTTVFESQPKFYAWFPW